MSENLRSRDESLTRRVRFMEKSFKNIKKVAMKPRTSWKIAQSGNEQRNLSENYKYQCYKLQIK